MKFPCEEKKGNLPSSDEEGAMTANVDYGLSMWFMVYLCFKKLAIISSGSTFPMPCNLLGRGLFGAYLLLLLVFSKSRFLPTVCCKKNHHVFYQLYMCVYSFLCLMLEQNPSF